MQRRPPGATRTATLFPYPSLCRSSGWQGRRPHHLGQTPGWRPAAGIACAVGHGTRKEVPFVQETTCLGRPPVPVLRKRRRPDRAVGEEKKVLLPNEGESRLKRTVRARASDTASSRPGHAPRLGRHPCLTRRRRPSMACFPHTPVGTPHWRFAVVVSLLASEAPRSKPRGDVSWPPGVATSDQWSARARGRTGWQERGREKGRKPDTNSQ